MMLLLNDGRHGRVCFRIPVFFSALFQFACGGSSSTVVFPSTSVSCLAMSSAAAWLLHSCFLSDKFSSPTHLLPSEQIHQQPNAAIQSSDSSPKITLQTSCSKPPIMLRTPNLAPFTASTNIQYIFPRPGQYLCFRRVCTTSSPCLYLCPQPFVLFAPVAYIPPSTSNQSGSRS